ncbi:MAG: hypothetical protein ABIG68_00180 [Acidobacteriota bacterium]
MTVAFKKRFRQASSAMQQWARRWRKRAERLDFLITAFAFCWLMVRFFFVALRRFRW